MQLYNTFSRQLEEFSPIAPPKVTMYSCGPTVYRDIHIGNLRTYLTTDIARRVLKLSGFDVTSVMNITDVGHFRYSSELSKTIDPIVEEARALGITPLELSQRYTEKFLKDTERLNVLPQDEMPKASEHIQEMIEVIQVLIEKGYAYQAEGNVYFNVEKFPDYGKLSGNTLDKMDELLKAVRISVETDKKDSADFALWKKAEDRVMSWESPWGMGVPGWHIECSVMAMKYLGVSLDLHLGGEDLIFPHHEDEIAQSESLTGQPFVGKWLHTSFLLVDDVKMSRSKKNVFTLKDLAEKGYSAMAFKYLTYQTHYRSKMNFTWEALDAAATALGKMYEIASQLPSPAGYANKYEVEFERVLGQDLNVPRALAIVWEMLRSDEKPEAKAAALYRMDDVLGFNILELSKKLVEVPENILRMVAERNALRDQKKFHLADQMRMKIEKLGYVVEDKKLNARVFKKIV